MKSFVEAIATAEAASGEGSKKQKLAALSGMTCVADLKLVWEAFNPYRVFNVRKWDEPQAYANVDPGYDAFFKLLDALHDRTITGNAARTAVTATLGLYTENTAKYLIRVLLKDLKCGASVDTFAKVYPTLNVPKFDVMLAGKVDEKYKWFFPVLAESKYDGNRLVAFVDRDERKVEYFSRGGRPSDYCAGLFDAELLTMADEVGYSICVDGEALAGSFQETMNARGSKGTDAKANLRFYAFDLMSMAEWKANHCPQVQTTRSHALESLIKKTGVTKVIKSKYKVCHDKAELNAFYSEVLAEGIGADGKLNGLGEGLILKNPNGHYEWERSKNWMKWKSVIDLDLTIVGFYEGEGRLRGTLGGVILRGYDENGNKVQARCGSGFDDETRLEIWLNTTKYKGKVAMIECQELSLAEGSDIYSARFPIFIRMRDDK